MIRLLLASLCLVTLAACGDDDTPADTGSTDATMDTGVTDTGATDTGATDTGTGDSATDTGAGDSATDTGTTDGGTCSAEQGAVAAFIESNKTCSEDSDCAQVGAPCYQAHEDCCVVYMANDYDTTMWGTLITDLMTCVGPGCACCAAIPADPGCNAGRCGPMAR